MDPFSPKSNVVVGRNGAGKSNFFAAVQFVLSDSDKYNNMGREFRQGLLHEGTGSAVMSAYVEVCFDNSEDRFHTGRPEFFLRRTIGTKKDEYSIDRKNATKTEVLQILESAGFSRSNPYYIVPQGRVTAITNMKDAERLNVLKEISGSNVYDQRRTDSLKLMTDTDQKRTKIDDLVGSIESRLKELEEERKDLDAYNKSDREARALKYSLERHREESLRNELDRIDQRRQNGAANTDQNQRQFIENEKEIARIDLEINQLTGEIKLLQDERAQLEDDRRESTRNKAQIEVEIKELTDGQSEAQRRRKRHEAQLKEVQQKIKAREDELKKLLPQYNAKKTEETSVRSQLAEAEGHRKRLEDKQGRTAFYGNKRQRDDALRQEINQVNMDLATRKAVLMDTNEEISRLKGGISQMEKEISELRSTIENRDEITMDKATKVQEARDKREQLIDRRKELWREEAKIDNKIANAETQLNAAERILSNVMDYNTSKGLETMRRLKQQPNNKLEGVYGTVAELIDVPDNYKTAAEVTAQNTLFHIVCDNDSTATRLVDLLNKERGGRLTCMPLNRLRSKPAQLPQATDAQPLIKKLTYDPMYERAVQHVFGKTIVCPTLDIAAGYARTHGVSALTPDGDKADQKGRLQGGWIDPSKSRLDAVRRASELRREVDDIRRRRREIENEIRQLEQQITAAASDVRQAEREQEHVERSYGPMRDNLRAQERDLQRRKDLLEEKQITASELESSINQLSDRQSDLESELSSDFKKAISRDEEQLLVTLSSNVQDLRRQLTTLTSKRAELETRKAEIEVEIRESLQPNLDQLLSADVGTGGSVNQPARLKECERLLKNLDRTIANYDAKIQETDNQIDQLNEQLSQKDNEKTEKSQTNRQIARAIEKQQGQLDRSIREKTKLQDELKKVQDEIRQQGTLTPELVAKYANWSDEKIERQLSKVQATLKKHGPVNKKALEQHERFTAQRADLIRRRRELEESRNSIENLIEVLDHRKDEAIERTFKQVSKAFAEIFVQLVPAGMGRLVIQRKSDKEAGRGGFDDESSDDEQQARGRGRKSTVESYTGVGISVSFNSKHDEQQRIQQLSGGQKSLCALALVFAIQQCDPAPFYLFDEIDANLDAQYRTAVAEMLQKLSGRGGEDGAGGGQFICTTFRPEMIHVAEKCYGVSFKNKASTINVVTKEVALGFVEDMQKQ